ncbi:MAG: ferric reductase-like transmembrane domain-containing protein [bacterium]|nr:ferric reductase-like transmembrane domain-containing protein [bacterium]
MPLVLWLADLGLQLDFTDFYSAMTTIGKIAGLVGVCLFASNIFLSGRYTFVDKLFGGLDRVYLFHRRIGISAFLLLTLHVLTMTIRTWQDSFRSVIDSAFDVTDTTINHGRFGYYGLLVVIIITLFVRLKYERLKRIHTFMGVFLFFGGLHVYFTPSDVAVNLALRYYILGIVTIALLSYVWRTVLKRWLVKRIIADVVEVNKLGDFVTEVIVKPRDGNVTFKAGQFNFWRFKQKGFPYEDHPFSITASTEEGRLRMSAKALGDFTKILPTLSVGAVAEIQGPFGGFSIDRSENTKQIWIAGGIGITPFMSMARTLRDTIGKDPSLKEYTISLFYSVKNDAEMIYKQELEDIAKKVPGFTFFPWVGERDGFISADKIVTKMKVIDADVFICGPKPLLNALSSQFKALGVSKSHIHFELFKLL